ncbi:MAG: hypothetical protein H8E25_04900 [Planctomycetes bacterium]|nr:hypothetical protein [Planctomycetota bacterium]
MLALRPILFCACLVVACAKAPDAALFYEQAKPLATAPAPTTVAMSVPESWQAIEIDQPFYLAKYDLPNGGRATVSYLGPNTDSIAMNIDRWMGQWTVPGSTPEEARDFSNELIGDQEVYKLLLKGTLNSTAQLGGGDARDHWMLIGGIMLKEFGAVYLKVIGPADDLEGQAATLFTNFAAANFESKN